MHVKRHRTSIVEELYLQLPGYSFDLIVFYQIGIIGSPKNEGNDGTSIKSRAAQSVTVFSIKIDGVYINSRMLMIDKMREFLKHVLHVNLHELDPNYRRSSFSCSYVIDQLVERSSTTLYRSASRWQSSWLLGFNAYFEQVL